jgi:hypothetical protein
MNLRALGPAAVWAGFFRSPQERLVRGLSLLMWETNQTEDASRHQLRHRLGFRVPPAATLADRVLAYRKVWSRLN